GAAQALHPAQQVLDGQRRDLMDRAVRDRHGQRLGPQAFAAASLARALAHELLVLRPHVLGRSLLVAARRAAEYALEVRLVGELAAVLTPVPDADLVVGAVEQDLLVLRVEVLPGDVRRDAEVLAGRPQDRARPTVLV